MAGQDRKNKISNNQKMKPSSTLQTLRSEIREWYGSLSVQELTVNKALVEQIEKLERLLSKSMVTS